MTYGHLQADCLYTGISSGPNARCRVWEAFTFTFYTSYDLFPHKEVPFGGRDDITPHLGGQIHKTPILGAWIGVVPLSRFINEFGAI